MGRSLKLRKNTKNPLFRFQGRSMSSIVHTGEKYVSSACYSKHAAASLCLSATV